MKGHLQQDVVCHGCLSCVIPPCWAAEPGGGGVFTPGVEVLGSCCCGFSCLLWIVSCLNADMETPRRHCFLLREEIGGWGGGTHEVSAVEWFHTGLCPFWSRRRAPGSPAGARGGKGRAWRCWDSPLPQAPAGKGGFASRPATWVLSPEESRELLGRWAAPSGHAQLVLRPQLGAPSAPGCSPGCCGGGTAPRCSVPASCSSLAGDFHKPHLSLFLLWSCLGSRLAHHDFSHRAWQGGLVISKPWLVCSRAHWLTSMARTSCSD